MKPNKKNKTKSNGVAKKLLYLLITATTFNQAYAQLAIKKYTINNGATTMSGDGVELIGSIGQVDAAPPINEGHGSGTYSLSSGFWQQNTDLIFKDNLE